MNAETQAVYNYLLTNAEGRAVYGFRVTLENYISVQPYEGFGGEKFDYRPAYSSWMDSQIEGTRLAFAVDMASKRNLWPAEMDSHEFLCAVNFTELCLRLSAERRASSTGYLPELDTKEAWKRLTDAFHNTPGALALDAEFGPAPDSWND